MNKSNKSCYKHQIQITEIHDGDTVTANIHLGFGVWMYGQRIRLARINAPELKVAISQSVTNEDKLSKSVSEKEDFWICESCGQEINSKEVFGGGYGHVLTGQDEKGEYCEYDCGPCKKSNSNNIRSRESNPAGELSLQYLKYLFEQNKDKEWMVETNYKKEKFGRWLCEVCFCDNDIKTNVSDCMVANNHAAIYRGDEYCI